MVGFGLKTLAVVALAASIIQTDAATSMRALQSEYVPTPTPAVTTNIVSTNAQCDLTQQHPDGLGVITDSRCVRADDGCQGPGCRYCKHGENVSEKYHDLPTCQEAQRMSVSAMSVPSSTPSAGLASIGETSVAAWELNLAGAAGIVLAISVMGFAAKKIMDRRRAAQLADNNTPSSKLVYRRGSVYQI